MITNQETAMLIITQADADASFDAYLDAMAEPATELDDTLAMIDDIDDHEDIDTTDRYWS